MSWEKISFLHTSIHKCVIMESCLYEPKDRFLYKTAAAEGGKFCLPTPERLTLRLHVFCNRCETIENCSYINGISWIFLNKRQAAPSFLIQSQCQAPCCGSIRDRSLKHTEKHVRVILTIVKRKHYTTTGLLPVDTTCSAAINYPWGS